MNLFYKPSLSELAALIGQGTEHANEYHVIVDHDGEVLVNTNSEISQAALDKFKFYFAEMKETDHTGQKSERYLQFLNTLFKNLVFCWEKGITGKVDFNMISKIQNRIFHREIRELREKAYPIRFSASL
jgi:hypothetical protein